MQEETMKVKNAFQWYRSYSASPEPVEIPAGAPVEYNKKNKQHYVKPSFFKEQGQLVEADDATYYGCRVARDNIEP
jgi:hypothetical protein